MLSYATLMINREWPLMRHGAFDSNAAMISMDAIDSASTFIPTNAAESNAQSATVAQLTIMHDARQRRIAENDSAVSWFEWLVLVLGASCIICFCWLFGLKNARTQLLMTSTVVATIVRPSCSCSSSNIRSARTSASARMRGAAPSITSTKCSPDPKAT